MADIPALVAFLRQRRLNLGLTLYEVTEHIGLESIGYGVLEAYENGDFVPCLSELIAWADALGCDVTFTIRPAPPMRTRFDSLDELRQDMRDNAWARRVAEPGRPDDIAEIERRLAEYAETWRGPKPEDAS